MPSTDAREKIFHHRQSPELVAAGRRAYREKAGYSSLPSNPVRMVPVEAATNVLVFMMSILLRLGEDEERETENEDGKMRKGDWKINQFYIINRETKTETGDSSD